MNVTVNYTLRIVHYIWRALHPMSQRCLSTCSSVCHCQSHWLTISCPFKVDCQNKCYLFMLLSSRQSNSKVWLIITVPLDLCLQVASEELSSTILGMFLLNALTELVIDIMIMISCFVLQLQVWTHGVMYSPCSCLFVSRLMFIFPRVWHQTCMCCR